MKKTLQTILILSLAFLAAFFFVPSIGKKFLRIQTSPMVLKEMRVEFYKLDNTLPRVEANERRRIEIVNFMNQRGIHLDPGPEGREHRTQHLSEEYSDHEVVAMGRAARSILKPKTTNKWREELRLFQP